MCFECMKIRKSEEIKGSEIQTKIAEMIKIKK